jgi:putative ABC transport system permease protein
VFQQDIRYALRSLGRVPGFTTVAMLTLALGIGGTTAIFSVVDGILLRPLPYPDSDAIVSVARVNSGANDRGAFSAADYLDYKRDNRSFAAFAGYREDIVDLSGTGDPVRLEAVETTAGFFEVVGYPPIAGRTYTEAVDRPGGPRVAVVSEGFWRQHLGASEKAVGQTVRLNGVPTTVVGVMPKDFAVPIRAELWVLAPADVPTSPVAGDGREESRREVQYFQAIGRLRPGVSVAMANEDLHAIGDRLAKQFPDTNQSETATAVLYRESLVGDVRSALLVLFGAVGFVLLIACANVASLLLARGTARRREFAVRTALGAGRGRLVGQLLTESLVLATGGGLLGLLMAYWGIDSLVALAPETIPRLSDVRLDPRVTAFAIGSTALVGVLFGIVPAFQSARRDVVDALKDGGRTGTARTRLQRALVVGEVALALILLIGAGLMLTSFARLRAVDPGFAVRNLVFVGVPLPQARYDNPAQARFYTQLYERLRENPVTARSALGFPTPFTGSNAAGGYAIEGAPARSRADRTIAQLGSISPGYFQAMGIPLLRGRDVALSDTQERPGVAVINHILADHEWPGQDPIGKRLSIGGDPASADSWITVVGIVGDSRRSDLQTAPAPAIYLPHQMFTLPYMAVVVRSDASEATIAAAVRSAVRALDPELPIQEVQTLDRVLERSTGQPRFRALLTGVFAAAALILAAVGLYGLISYTVAQRAPELAVRLALGATPGQVGRLVIGQGLTLAAAGVLLGVGGALAATRLLEGLLFAISATDPGVYATLAALILAVAAIASLVPARRAMRVDPITALRAE